MKDYTHTHCGECGEPLNDHTCPQQITDVVGSIERRISELRAMPNYVWSNTDVVMELQEVLEGLRGFKEVE